MVYCILLQMLMYCGYYSLYMFRINLNENIALLHCIAITSYFQASPPHTVSTFPV